MKKILFFISVVVVGFSCKSTVSTTTGLENNAHIKVVKANYSELYNESLTLIIDDQEFLINEIFTDQNSMKASVIPTTPGAHHIVIKEVNKIIYDKSIFLDNRETRKIILE